VSWLKKRRRGGAGKDMAASVVIRFSSRNKMLLLDYFDDTLHASFSMAFRKREFFAAIKRERSSFVGVNLIIFGSVLIPSAMSSQPQGFMIMS